MSIPENLSSSLEQKKELKISNVLSNPEYFLWQDSSIDSTTEQFINNLIEQIEEYSHNPALPFLGPVNKLLALLFPDTWYAFNGKFSLAAHTKLEEVLTRIRAANKIKKLPSLEQIPAPTIADKLYTTAISSQATLKQKTQIAELITEVSSSGASFSTIAKFLNLIFNESGTMPTGFKIGGMEILWPEITSYSDEDTASKQFRIATKLKEINAAQQIGLEKASLSVESGSHANNPEEKFTEVSFGANLSFPKHKTDIQSDLTYNFDTGGYLAKLGTTTQLPEWLGLPKGASMYTEAVIGKNTVAQERDKSDNRVGASVNFEF